MSALIDAEARLGYLINDADEHSVPPVSAYLEYADPDKRDLVITEINRANGAHEYVWGGKPDPSPVRSLGHAQVVGSSEVQSRVGVDERGRSDDMGGAAIPGSLLNKLNPLKGL